MNPDQLGKYITLDWDNISIDTAYQRVNYICDNYTNVKKLVLSLSPTKGFHVRLYCFGDTNIARMRKELKDDGRRLVHDILNRTGDVHDTLWSRKTVYGITYQEEHLKTIEMKK